MVNPLLRLSNIKYFNFEMDIVKQTVREHYYVESSREPYHYMNVQAILLTYFMVWNSYCFDYHWNSFMCMYQQYDWLGI